MPEFIRGSRLNRRTNAKNSDPVFQSSGCLQPLAQVRRSRFKEFFLTFCEFQSLFHPVERFLTCFPRGWGGHTDQATGSGPSFEIEKFYCASFMSASSETQGQSVGRGKRNGATNVFKNEKVLHTSSRHFARPWPTDCPDVFGAGNANSNKQVYIFYNNIE